jgi:TonB family protein
MDNQVLLNLLAYSVQIGGIALLAWLASACVRIDAPDVRYGYWRAVLILCLALPWLQGRREVVLAPGTEEAIGGTAGSVSVATSFATAEPVASWLPLVGVVLLAGMALRVAWLACSLARLRRMRHNSVPTSPSAEFDDVQASLATVADVRYASRLRQPVTFGVVHPVVLLPEALRGAPAPIRAAVLCHELLHVRRRDWVWLLAEEAVRAVFWFHPAVWFLIARVQLAREEVVDEMAVLATGSRRRYVEALLAFADDIPLSPAAAFARRRHLFRRIVLLSKETHMSSRRIVVSCGVMALVLAAGTWYAVRAFPLTQTATTPSIAAQAPDARPERRENPITPENPIPRRLSGGMPVYPPELIGTGLRALVTLSLLIDASGAVARVDPGPLLSIGSGNTPTRVRPTAEYSAAFRSAAIDAARRWLYEPPAQPPIRVQVGFTFSPDVGAELAAHGDPEGQGSLIARALQRAGLPAPAPPTSPAVRRQADRAGAADISWTQGVVRVGDVSTPPKKIKDVAPAYPVDAQDARVQGAVILEVLIDEDGTVADTRVLRSIQLLDQAAIDAVRQWEFTPTLVNGVPTRVVMTVTVRFTLS